MKSFANRLAVSLLLFNGTSALYGGWSLITHPDGSTLELSTSYLAHSPFTNYLIPGIVLFIANGLCSIAALIALLAKSNYAGLAVAAQGLFLTGWIGVQLMLIGPVYFLQALLGGVGVLLLFCGLVLARR
jgi:hypothetical protein